MHAIQSCVSARAFTCIIYGGQILQSCHVLWTSREVGDLKPARMPLLDEPLLSAGAGAGGIQIAMSCCDLNELSKCLHMSSCSSR